MGILYFGGYLISWFCVTCELVEIWCTWTYVLQ